MVDFSSSVYHSHSLDLKLMDVSPMLQFEDSGDSESSLSSFCCFDEYDDILMKFPRSEGVDYDAESIVCDFEEILQEDDKDSLDVKDHVDNHGGNLLCNKVYSTGLIQFQSFFFGSESKEEEVEQKNMKIGPTNLLSENEKNRIFWETCLATGYP